MERKIDIPEGEATEVNEETPELATYRDKARQDISTFNSDTVDINDDYNLPGMHIDIPLLNDWSGLMYASCLAKPELVNYFLCNDADPNYDVEQSTSLHLICSNRDVNNPLFLECAKSLVERGADINFMDRFGTSPLMFATKSGNIKLVEFLIDAGADINAKDVRGLTPLAHAALNGHRGIVWQLVNAKADLTILNVNGISIPELCYINNYPELGDDVSKMTEDKLSHPEAARLQKCNLAPDRRKKDFEMLENLLNKLDLKSIVPIFADQHMTYGDLETVTDEQLLKIGIVNQIHREKILQAVQACQNAMGKDSEKKLSLDFSDLVRIMENIAIHIGRGNSNIQYYINYLDEKPESLKLSKELCPFHELDRTVGNILESLDETQNNLRALNETIGQLEEMPSSTPKDKNFKSMFFGALAVLAGGVAWFCLARSRKNNKLI